MFRFSIDKDARVDTNPGQLASANVVEDEDFAQRLQDADEYKASERYYRAEDRTPKTLREAIEYVQGIFFHPPARVWIGGELHEVQASDLSGTDKPVA